VWCTPRSAGSVRVADGADHGACSAPGSIKEALEVVDEAVDVARRAQLADVLVGCLLTGVELHPHRRHLARAREPLDEGSPCRRPG
jgi:hypothetical protein